MGFEAYINCRCSEDFTSRPDFTQYANLSKNVKASEDVIEMFNQSENYEAWKNSPCPHKNQKLLSEQIYTASHMNDFKKLISVFGGEKRFPLLTKCFSGENEGTILNGDAIPALQEVRTIEYEIMKAEIILKDKSTGEIKIKSNPDKSYIFFSSDKLNYGIDKEGFFIMEIKPKFLWFKQSNIIFRSMNFTQREIGNLGYSITDKLTGQEYMVDENISFTNTNDPNTIEFIVTREINGISLDFLYMVEILKKMLRIMLTSRTPLIWAKSKLENPVTQNR